jgi:hypothetical protein
LLCFVWYCHCWTSPNKHVQDEVEHHHWEVDGVTDELFGIWEFTICLKPDEDSSEESGCSEVEGDI